MSPRCWMPTGKKVPAMSVDANSSARSAAGPHHYKANGKRYLGASPSKKSVRRLKTTVGSLLVPGNNDRRFKEHRNGFLAARYTRVLRLYS
jgi:hypothetical protein